MRNVFREEPGRDRRNPHGGSSRQTVQHPSLALRPIVERLLETSKPTILDLGSASGLNVEFFSRFSCKLFIADLYQALISRSFRPTEEHRLTTVFAELLPYKPGTEFDLILAWDLLDYLDSVQIEVLGRRLSQFCKAGTLLFALISYSKQIPARPSSFRIQSVDTLHCERATLTQRASPRHKEPELCRRLTGFRVESAFVLRNGIQEYIFRYEPPPPDLRVVRP